MRPHVAIGLALATGAAGFAAGRAFDAPASTSSGVDAIRDATPRDQHERTRSGDDPRTERDRDRAQARVGDEERAATEAERSHSTSERSDAPTEDAPEPGGPTEGDGDGAHAIERGNQQRDLVSDAENCEELLGKPIARPKDVPARFSGASVSRAVSEGIEQAGVAGDVEGVDCSEFPCIVFARLAGDEEDIEEIERSAALDPYEGDVLTLLLWATTVEEDARTHATAKETGLFALAYYDFDDRAEIGEELDRRIRARVLEVWNAERPGPPGSGR